MIKPKMLDNIPADKIIETTDRKFMTPINVSTMEALTLALEDIQGIHSHNNLEVLSKLSVVDGKLFYDNVEVGAIPTTTELTVVDQAGHFTSQDKNLENILAELFTSASNGKSLVANVIGSPSVSTDTFSQLASDIQTIKNTFVANLGGKGITSETTDTLSSLVSKVSTIQNGGANSIKNTKLNLTAPTTHIETLTNETPLQNLATSVLKFQSGATGVTEYVSNFNNGDGDNFNYPSSVDFNGVMHTIDVTLNGSSTSTELLTIGEVFTSDLVDLTKFNYLGNITITPGVIPTIAVNGSCPPALVTAKSDIDLSGILGLSQIIWTGNASGDGVLKLAVSVDGSTTWKSFDGYAWQSVDVNSPVDFKAKGMTPATVNSLTSIQLEELRLGAQVIRFAYYLEKVNLTDVSNNDAITLKVDMQGEDIIAPQTAFSYALGSDKKTITYTINTSGTYTFIYADSV